MKYLLFLCLFLSSILSFGQSNESVEAAAEKLRLSLIDPNAEVLQNLTTANLSYGHSSGKIENQSEFIEALVSGSSDFKTAQVSDQTITMNGKNTAIVRHKLIAEIVDGDKINKVNLGILLVWVKEKNSWKLAARQAFRL